MTDASEAGTDRDANPGDSPDSDVDSRADTGSDPVHLDVSGAVCPQPTLLVRRCLAELDPGEELLVEGDYPPAERSIRRTCYKHGYAVAEGPPADEGEFALRIRVTGEATLAERTGSEE